MFVENEYYVRYYEIITKANIICPRTMSKKEAKKIRGYVEDHHIIPKSIGGDNSIVNKVWLTAKEHFECHVLLTKITDGLNNGKMWCAIWRMMNKQSNNQDRDYNFTAEQYAEAREKSAKTHSIRFSGINNHFHNKKHTEKSKKDMSLKKKGKTYEEIFGAEKAIIMKEARRKESTGRTHTDFSKNKISVSKLGKKRPDVTERHRLAKLEKIEKYGIPIKPSDLIHVCPHCNIKLSGRSGGANFKRWHGDRCKKIKD